MGVPGVAIATVVAQGISAIWLARWILKKTDLIRLSRDYWRVDWGLAGRIFRIGLPAGLSRRWSPSAW